MFKKTDNKTLAQFVLLLFVFFLAAFVSGNEENWNSTEAYENAFPFEEHEEETGKMLLLQETLTTKDGLASDTVTAIFEDSKGNIWFGTTHGVSRYDGKSFHNFTKKDGLAANVVGAIFEDSKGNLWFGTGTWNAEGSGVSRYDGKIFQNFTTKEGLAGQTVMDIFEDKEGNLWFATKRGAGFYDGKMFHNFTSGFAHNDSWNNDRLVSAIAQDKTGDLWFGCYGGISHGNPFRHFTTDDGLQSGWITDILFDKKGILWIARAGGGGAGLTRYDGESFDNLPKSEGLPSDITLTIMQDKKGNLWFGNLLGVSVYDGKIFRSYNEKDGLPHKGLGVISEEINGRRVLKRKGVSAILEDRNGTLWFATLGGGVSRGVSESSEISKKR